MQVASRFKHASSFKHGDKIDNPSKKKYLNKIKIWITFKIKTRYYLELLTSETMKLLGSTENKIPHLEITKVVLVHFNIVNNDQWLSATFKSFIHICP